MKSASKTWATFKSNWLLFTWSKNNLATLVALAVAQATGRLRLVQKLQNAKPFKCNVRSAALAYVRSY